MIIEMMTNSPFFFGPVPHHHPTGGPALGGLDPSLAALAAGNPELQRMLLQQQQQQQRQQQQQQQPPSFGLPGMMSGGGVGGGGGGLGMAIGICGVCELPISAAESPLVVGEKQFHENCFTCWHCCTPLKGDVRHAAGCYYHPQCMGCRECGVNLANQPFMSSKFSKWLYCREHAVMGRVDGGSAGRKSMAEAQQVWFFVLCLPFLLNQAGMDEKINPSSSFVIYLSHHHLSHHHFSPIVFSSFLFLSFLFLFLYLFFFRLLDCDAGDDGRSQALR